MEDKLCHQRQNMKNRKNSRNSGLSRQDISMSRNYQNETTKLDGLKAQEVLFGKGEKKRFWSGKRFKRQDQQQEYDTSVGEVGVEEQICRSEAKNWETKLLDGSSMLVESLKIVMWEESYVKIIMNGRLLD